MASGRGAAAGRSGGASLGHRGELFEPQEVGLFQDAPHFVALRKPDSTISWVKTSCRAARATDRQSEVTPGTR